MGTHFILQEESYTSKALFLDNDPIPTYDPTRKAPPVFSGQRVKRGLYRAKDGRTLHADANGSANILRKALPNALWAEGIEAIVVRPLWLTLPRSDLPDAQAAA